MRVAIAYLSMFLASGSSAQRPEPPSVKHIICSAYATTMATVMYSSKLPDKAENMGKFAETHAAIAIALDELQGLPAWGTRDLISQLTTAFQFDAATLSGALALGKKHNDFCAALAHRIPEIQREIAARKAR